MLLLLRPDWPGTFRRTVRHEDGLATTYVFEPGVPQEVAAGDIPGVSSDLGKALCIPKVGTGKPDYKATEAAVADLDSFEATAMDSPVDDLLSDVVVASAIADPLTDDEEGELETVNADGQADAESVLSSVDDEPAAEEASDEQPLRTGRRKRR